jgi:hypothetical protein
MGKAYGRQKRKNKDIKGIEKWTTGLKELF